MSHTVSNTQGALLGTCPSPGSGVATSLSSHPYTLEGIAKAAFARVLDGADVTTLLHALQFDPLSTARSLRAANSPFFSTGQSAGSAAVALKILGVRTLAMIALASSFDYGLGRRWSGQLELLRRHSIRVAVLAQQVACSTGHAQQSDLAFVAGLLHDIHPMLHYRDDLGNATAADCASRTAALLRRWNLPAAIVEAIGELGTEPSRLASGPSLGTVLTISHELVACMDGPVAQALHRARSFEVQLGLPEGVLDDAFAMAATRIHGMEVTA